MLLLQQNHFYHILYFDLVIFIFLFQSSAKRFGASLGALSSGRVGISSLATGLLASCCTIAIRYSCVRKQFGPSPGVEIPVIEYQTQVKNLLMFLH